MAHGWKNQEDIGLFAFMAKQVDHGDSPSWYIDYDVSHYFKNKHDCFVHYDAYVSFVGINLLLIGGWVSNCEDMYHLCTFLLINKL